VDTVFRQKKPRVSSGLLATATAPDVVAPFTDERQERRPKKPPPIRPAARSRPLGLPPCPLLPFVNPFLQLLAYLPIYRELLPFAPRPWDVLHRFLLDYAREQEADSEECPVSHGALALFQQLPLPPDEPPFPWLLNAIGAIFPPLSPPTLATDPRRRLFWDRWAPLDRLFKHGFNDYFVFPHISPTCPVGSCEVIPRQLFQPACYELKAFIEWRPEGVGQSEYIVYLKFDGSWYQCRDLTVAPILSPHLGMPLHSGACLLYFAKVRY
jgi:hypothetical protein